MNTMGIVRKMDKLGRVVPTTNTQPKPGYIYVEEDYVRDLMVLGMQNMCLMCEGGHQDRKG